MYILYRFCFLNNKNLSEADELFKVRYVDLVTDMGGFIFPID